MTELVSVAPGTGRQTVLAQLIRTTRTARQRIALIDGADGFVPTDVLRHLVWVRGRRASEAFAAADILVRAVSSRYQRRGAARARDSSGVKTKAKFTHDLSDRFQLVLGELHDFGRRRAEFCQQFDLRFFPFGVSLTSLSRRSSVAETRVASPPRSSRVTIQVTMDGSQFQARASAPIAWPFSVSSMCSARASFGVSCRWARLRFRAGLVAIK
jgi:hypothetical protein